MNRLQILTGDCRDILPALEAGSVQCCVTSRPYWGLCILAGSKPGDLVLDPFAGSGTTGKVALELGRKAVLVELNPAYIELAEDRTFVTPGFL